MTETWGGTLCAMKRKKKKNMERRCDVEGVKQLMLHWYASGVTQLPPKPKAAVSYLPHSYSIVRMTFFFFFWKFDLWQI